MPPHAPVPPLPVPPAPPASAEPQSPEDCRRIAETIRRVTLTKALDAYNLRDWYQAVIRYAIAARDPAPIYDFWWAVERHRAAIGRGFYLDLWDLYDEAEAGKAAFSEADR